MFYRYLAVIVTCFLLWVPALGQVKTANVDGDATATIGGTAYSYHYHIYSPRELIPTVEAAPAKIMSAKDALIVMFAYMHSGKVTEWRQMWKDAPNDPKFTATDDQLKQGWKVWLEKPQYILYELTYKGQTVFVTEQEGTGHRAKFFFKKDGDQWWANRDLFADVFARDLDDPGFSPATGKLTAQQVAYYNFDILQPAVVVKDTATAVFLGADHSINDGLAINVRQVDGPKGGKALEFDGTGYVQLPITVPLSLFGGKCTVGLWLNPGEVPEKPENKIGEGQYACTVISRDGLEQQHEGYMLLEVRKASGETKLFCQIGSDLNGGHALTMQAPIKTGVWAFVQITYNGKIAKLEIDGKTVEASSPAGVDAPKVTGPMARFLLGKRQGKTACPYIGKIGDLGISDDVAE
jgi:hypothetical protein